MSYKLTLLYSRIFKFRLEFNKIAKELLAGINQIFQEKLNNHWALEQISERIKLELNKQIIFFSIIYDRLYKDILE